MIYGSVGFLGSYLSKDFDVPLWVAYYISSTNFNASSDPFTNYKTPWKNWVVWQVSELGDSKTLTGTHDVNMMKKDFYDNPAKYWKT